MKQFVLIMGIISTVILGACAAPTETNVKQESNKQEVTKDVQDSKVVNGIKLTLEKQEIVKAISKDNKETNLYTFIVTGVNVSSINKGLGSADFILQTADGKRLDVDYNFLSFGDEIKPGKSIKGPVSFSLKKDQKASKLIYRIGDKELLSWEVTN
ncbi:DUF4352 domain-containing protein [Listeria booriae]|uniref:DUF4354 domain-containing protein n=1 Tax=Listeria booriae TaxID=1552123 RepID=UPI001623AE0B|nr:DUF4354 domain-containing protein [Listeria booriae]MBC1576045.1 DUF4352 domain-containing protein [Listeria booriae]MBC2057993.1 DUF4352 domain-containing protein [Listeria booriae]MBC2069387.1 DUF4352 domain-containing protein [Listeria booriae]MBC2106583.1 DUF4352 domain-containing protein [Listeria booriae]